MIVALAGGVGGAKLAQGLYRALPPDTLVVVGNTADDFVHFGLPISPDLDTVMYTLAGIANPATGWGVVDDTFQALDLLGRYGAETWFRVGDRDFATHVRRAELLRAGRTLTAVTAALADGLGVRARLLPMCDEPVATVVTTPAGDLPFQEYFVRRQHQDEVGGVRFAEIERATLPSGVANALATAEAIVLCPSNPLVSLGPILAVPGCREALRAAPGVKVAVSPIVGGRALKGPADRMLAGLGHDVSPVGVAALYRDFLDGFVLDEEDRALAPRVEALGLPALVAQTVMGGPEDRERLAQEIVQFARGLAGRRPADCTRAG
ncbi:MAG TPA: 2-phospho-L-lactate transferase [Thermomicrobiales bacterium]|nr:2-phospho-L-lactate transferase [Thermomicrobiales bacterium]